MLCTGKGALDVTHCLIGRLHGLELEHKQCLLFSILQKAHHLDGSRMEERAMLEMGGVKMN
jgi:hypothetical protein